MTVIIRRNIGLPSGDDIIIALKLRIISRSGVHVRLPPIPFLMATALLAASPNLIGHDEMHDYLYGDREDGGPLTNNINVHAYRLRAFVASLGITLEAVHGRGFIAHIEKNFSLVRAA